MSALLALADAARLTLAAGAVAVGAVLLLGGALGLLRFPDFYTRLHAAAAADGAGAALVVLGLAIAAPSWGVALKLALLAALLGALAPTLSHLAANAAHAAGLAPIAGRYVAPRPGARASRDADL